MTQTAKIVICLMHKRMHRPKWKDVCPAAGQRFQPPNEFRIAAAMPGVHFVIAIEKSPIIVVLIWSVPEQSSDAWALQREYPDAAGHKLGELATGKEIDKRRAS